MNLDSFEAFLDSIEAYLDSVEVYRYIIVGAILAGSVLLILGTISAYVFDWLSSQTVQLLIAGTGALGTVLLASLTLLTLLDNRELVKEHKKQRRKPIQKNILRLIVLPAIEVVDENKEKLFDPRFIWAATNDSELPEVDLELIAERGDPVLSDEFVDSYPDVVDTMMKYDDKVLELDELSNEFTEETEEPLSKYLQQKPIKDSDGSIVQAFYAQNIILLRTDDSFSAPDWWNEHKEEISRIAFEHAGEEYEEFRKVRNDLFNYSNAVRDTLIDTRKSIELEYGIYLREELESENESAYL
ncbi:hypothetical protein EGH22_00245 [Halomicroarcula sp. F28]|uniref:hypothetical protein n=1 Tax=Haloarcula salinisoli TaxID=2487746 RepID=UPI001C734352|nr:hypothetical protein [Halomicroarcula salinisoli]MBX0284746.1 hypothetical protein [Halomicroarcula salinisoli]